MANAQSDPMKADEESPVQSPVEEAIPTSNTAKLKSGDPSNKRLSAVSKMYDVDGDGQLDEAEMAMRDMDQTGRGYLTNEKVYKLMQEHLNMQKDLFKFKKVIIGLVAFVVLLTLCNLGTSFAAASLAKDTTTNSQNQLVSSDSKQALGTQSTAEQFEAQRVDAANSDEATGSARGLIRVGVDTYVSIPSSSANKMIKQCNMGNTVDVKRTWAFDSTTTSKTICSAADHSGDYDGSGNEWVSMDLENGVSITRIDPSNPDSDYIITGDLLTQDENHKCDIEADCDGQFVCASNSCQKVQIEVDTYEEIEESVANTMLTNCQNGKTVDVKRTFSSGQYVVISLCSPLLVGNYVTNGAYFTNVATGIRSHSLLRNSGSTTYAIDGDGFTQDQFELCDTGGDCDDEFECALDAESNNLRCDFPEEAETTVINGIGGDCASPNTECQPGLTCYPDGICNCDDDGDCVSPAQCLEDSTRPGFYSCVEITVPPSTTVAPGSCSGNGDCSIPSVCVEGRCSCVEGSSEGCLVGSVAPYCHVGINGNECGCDASSCSGSQTCSLPCDGGIPVCAEPGAHDQYCIDVHGSGYCYDGECILQ